MVAVTTHGGAAADTATVKETVIEAGMAVAELIAEKTAEGQYQVHDQGVEEVVADKGYHSNDVMVELAEVGVRSYMAEPNRGNAQLERQEDREGRGVCQPSAHTRRSWQAPAAAT